MDIVSFEVAKKLKATGFPQEMAFKQVYWEVDCENDKGIVFKTFKICVYMLGYMAMPYLVPLEFRGEHVLPDYASIYFAPTALDLIKQLPPELIGWDLIHSKPDDLAKMWIELNTVAKQS
jgi:hypothetical protein